MDQRREGDGREHGQHIHVHLDIEHLLPVVMLLAHILKGNDLDDRRLAELGDAIQKLHKPVKELKAAVAAAPLPTP